MAKRSKTYKKQSQLVTPGKVYKAKEAVALVKKVSYSKFDGSIEAHISINLPKNTDPKSIKLALSLPHTVARAVKVAIITGAAFVDKAKEAGADIAGGEDVIKEIQGGKMSFDVLMVTPDMMPKVAVLGKVLGPKGLMPNPKNGTVVDPAKLAAAVGEFKKGKLTIRADQFGGLHLPIGKASFTDEQLVENLHVLLKAVSAEFNKPVETLVKGVIIAPTMGKSVKIDLKSV